MLTFNPGAREGLCCIFDVLLIQHQGCTFKNAQITSLSSPASLRKPSGGLLESSLKFSTQPVGPGLSWPSSSALHIACLLLPPGPGVPCGVPGGSCLIPSSFRYQRTDQVSGKPLLAGPGHARFSCRVVVKTAISDSYDCVERGPQGRALTTLTWHIAGRSLQDEPAGCPEVLTDLETGCKSYRNCPEIIKPTSTGFMAENQQRPAGPNTATNFTSR